MATQNSTDKENPAEGNSAGECKCQQLIEDERRRLQKARAILDCLTVGLEYEENIDFADVTAVASELIGDAIANLDSTVLGRRGSRQEQQTAR